MLSSYSPVGPCPYSSISPGLNCTRLWGREPGESRMRRWELRLELLERSPREGPCVQEGEGLTWGGAGNQLVLTPEPFWVVQDQ